MEYDKIICQGNDQDVLKYFTLKLPFFALQMLTKNLENPNKNFLHFLRLKNVTEMLWNFSIVKFLDDNKVDVQNIAIQKLKILQEKILGISTVFLFKRFDIMPRIEIPLRNSGKKKNKLMTMTNDGDLSELQRKNFGMQLLDRIFYRFQI